MIKDCRLINILVAREPISQNDTAGGMLWWRDTIPLILLWIKQQPTSSFLVLLGFCDVPEAISLMR